MNECVKFHRKKCVWLYFFVRFHFVPVAVAVAVASLYSSFRKCSMTVGYKLASFNVSVSSISKILFDDWPPTNGQITLYGSLVNSGYLNGMYNLSALSFVVHAHSKM